MVHSYILEKKLIEKEMQIVARLRELYFKASNGWLEKWKKRYNMKELKVCGESGDVVGTTIDSWKERIPEIVHGYRKDILNLDETFFWQALPDRGFIEKGKRFAGGKRQAETNSGSYRHSCW